MRNARRGIRPPYSGGFNNAYFKEGMGCPIRSEIWAFVHPGDPDAAVAMALQDGSLDHEGNSCWGEAFLAYIESEAFFEQDIRLLLRRGQMCIRDRDNLRYSYAAAMSLTYSAMVMAVLGLVFLLVGRRIIYTER